MQVNELKDVISQLEFHNESVNPTKVSGRALAIKSKVTRIEILKKWRKKALYISRAGRALGKSKYWFSVRSLDNNTKKSLNFEKISSRKNFKEEMLLRNRELFEVTEEKLDELEDWK